MASLVSEIMKNLPPDQSRLLFSILITFPLGFLNNFIHSRILRVLYSLICGVLVQFYMFQSAVIHVLLACIWCLILIKICDRKSIGWIVTIFMFTYLSILHIYRMIYDYGGWTMDITTVFMGLVCKFSSFAFCYSDGAKSDSELTVFTKKNAIKEFSLLDYFSYIYFYPTCLMGPSLEFSDFRDYISEDKDYENIPKLIVLVEGAKRLLLALTLAGLFLALKPYINIDFYWENEGGKYIPNIIIFYILYLNKYRYYAGFLFAESICYVSGVSLKKVGENYEFSKVESVHVAETESTTSIVKFFQHWNISVHLWLKKYIHFRIYDNPQDYKDKSKVMKAKMITFMVSGFWHGFYPSYYIIFSHFSMYIAVEEYVNNLQKNVLDKNYPVISCLINYTKSFVFISGACYLLAILDSLHIAKMFKFMQSIYYMPSLIIITGYITITILSRIKSKKE